MHEPEPAKLSPEEKARFERQLGLDEAKRLIKISAIDSLMDAHAKEISALPEHPLHQQALIWLERDDT